jgi:hypothetical protein
VESSRRLIVLICTSTLSGCSETVSRLPSEADRVVWADNADAVSKAYSGSGALKTDFTRTGKRSKRGLLQDGQNSVERYVRNNFYDQTKQVRPSPVAVADRRMPSTWSWGDINHGNPSPNPNSLPTTDLSSSKQCPTSSMPHS